MRPLFLYAVLEKEGLLKSPEEHLIGNRVFDRLQVRLGAGPHDELGLVPFTHGDGEPDQIAAMVNQDVKA